MTAFRSVEPGYPAQDAQAGKIVRRVLQDATRLAEQLDHLCSVPMGWWYPPPPWSALRLHRRSDAATKLSSSNGSLEVSSPLRL